MNMNFAQPESSAESLVRMGGAALAVAGALTLWGLYSTDNPTNWLSNVGVSVGDNGFRTLSMTGAGALIIGGGLFMRKGLYLILAGILVTLALVGHGKWYTVGNQVSTSVKGVTSPAAKAAKTHFVSTGVDLTPDQKAWCDKDDDEDGVVEASDTDGKANSWNSALSRTNCQTGQIHQVAQ